MKSKLVGMLSNKKVYMRFLSKWLFSTSDPKETRIYNVASINLPPLTQLITEEHKLAFFILK